MIEKIIQIDKFKVFAFYDHCFIIKLYSYFLFLFFIIDGVLMKKLLLSMSLLVATTQAGFIDTVVQNVTGVANAVVTKAGELKDSGYLPAVIGGTVAAISIIMIIESFCKSDATRAQEAAAALQKDIKNVQNLVKKTALTIDEKILINDFYTNLRSVQYYSCLKNAEASQELMNTSKELLTHFDIISIIKDVADYRNKQEQHTWGIHYYACSSCDNAGYKWNNQPVVAFDYCNHCKWYTTHLKQF